MTRPCVRWWNRLAAWLYGIVEPWLGGLAFPVWEAETEAEWEELHAREAALVRWPDDDEDDWDDDDEYYYADDDWDEWGDVGW